MFGLQGCFSTATSRRPWLPVSAAVASPAGSRRGASRGRRVARFVLAAVAHVGEGSHHLVLAKSLLFLAGGSGEGTDGGSPEEGPVVVPLPELSLAGRQAGCREAQKACEELGKVVRAPRAPRSEAIAVP